MYFQLSDFKPIPETLGFKKLSQVTNCIRPNDFTPNGIKPRDHLSMVTGRFGKDVSAETIETFRQIFHAETSRIVLVLFLVI